MISIDHHFDGNKVHAYANREEFEAFADRGVVYQVETPPGELLQNPSMATTPPVLALGNQIQQVLLNLLINARQAMASPSPVAMAGLVVYR